MAITVNFTEASGVADSIYGKSQAPVRMFIEQQSEALNKKSLVDKMFSMQKSTHWAEKYTGMTAMDNFTPVGENGTYPTSAHYSEGFSKTVNNVTFKNQFAISREMVEDSILINFKRQPLAFIQSYYRTRETLGAKLYGEAITQGITANTATRFQLDGSHGEYFYTSGSDSTSAAYSTNSINIFASNHPSSISGNNTTQSNKFNLPFSAANLATVETAMQNFKGDNGEILNITPDTIIIPNIGALKDAVFSVIGADKSPETSNNGYNYQFGRWNVIINPYMNPSITEARLPWVLVDSEYMNNYAGAIFQDRTALDVRSVIDDDNDANVWKGYARFGAAFGDWRFAAMSYTPASSGNS